MKTKSPAQSPMAQVEQDGYGVKNHPEIVDDSSDDEQVAASLDHWEQRFDEEVSHYLALGQKRRALEKKRASPKEPVRPQNAEPQRKGVGAPEIPGEPQLHRRGRAATFRETLRGGLARLSRTSLNQDNMQALTLGELSGSRWSYARRLEFDANGFAVLDNLPPKIKHAMAATYREFLNDKRYGVLQGQEREQQLKLVLAKKLLALTLMGADSEFDMARIGSASAINRYLSEKFGLKIDSEPRSPRNQPSSAQTQPESADFRDLLVQEAVLRSRNYQVNWAMDLSNKDTDPFVRKIYTETIEAPKKNEAVSKVPGQRTDVMATFQRDFPHSTYEAEAEDGSIRRFNSVDEFVEFIGDPQKSGLPAKVSHFACQNTGMLIKNLLFTKTDDKDQPQSPLQLFDGTPIAISTSPKATYRLKKAADGTVTLIYRSEVDTTGASALKKVTARLLTAHQDKDADAGVLIEDARAVITLDIDFRPDGTERIGTLQLRAEGWNQITQ